MELLIDNGADPNTTARTAAGYAYGVVDYACMLLSAEALQCLLEHGAKRRFFWSRPTSATPVARRSA